MKRSTAGTVGAVLAGALAVAACGSSAPSPAGALIAQIPGCSQVQTWGGNSLLGTTSNGSCYLNDGLTQVEILTWPGDTADQSSYANSLPFVAPGPCTITGDSPVPWAANVDIADTAPAYAASVQQTITESIGGTSPGGRPAPAPCRGTVITHLSVTTRDRDRRHRVVRDAATAQVAVTADQDSVRAAKVTAVSSSVDGPCSRSAAATSPDNEFANRGQLPITKANYRSQSRRPPFITVRTDITT